MYYEDLPDGSQGDPSSIGLLSPAGKKGLTEKEQDFKIAVAKSAFATTARIRLQDPLVFSHQKEK